MFAAWAISGIGWVSPSAAWMVLYSLMPARWTALSIASGGIVATPLFLIVGSIGVPALGVAGAVALVAASGGLAYYLLSKADKEKLAEANSQESEHRKPVMALKASLSVIAHGISYGFIVIMVSSLGLHAILIAGTAGIVSSFVAFFWARRRTKTSWTTESAQRITIPLIAAALLFAPFCSEAGRIVCGAVGIGAFSYATLMEWTGQVVKNAEFQLFPLQRFAIGRLAQWTGFLIGALIAYITFYHTSMSPVPLSLITCVLAVIIITTFVVYDNTADENDQLLDVVLGDPENLIIEPPKNAAPFRERCDALIERFQLSSREAEVFRYLAKGRNAEYIQQKLFISSNTVKTHISHIYKKMGINNQQWLIDLVDQRDGRDDAADNGSR